MTKNEIIEKVVDRLLRQRENLSQELGSLNHNEPTFFEKRTTLENAIYNLDAQIERRVNDCEIILP